MRVGTPQPIDMVLPPPTGGTMPQPPQTPSRLRQTPSRPRQGAPRVNGQEPLDPVELARPMPSHPRTDTTVTYTTTWPTRRGPITQTITQSTSQPTSHPSRHIVVDVDDFDSGDEDFDLGDCHDFDEPPASPTPLGPSAVRTHAPFDPPSPPALSYVTGTTTSHVPVAGRAVSQTTANIAGSPVLQPSPMPTAPPGPSTPAPYKIARRHIILPPIPRLVVRASDMLYKTALAKGIRRPRVADTTVGVIIKEYLPRHPSTLLRPQRSSRKWFALVGGGDSGIYPNWTKVTSLCEGTLRISEGREDYDEAFNIYQWAYDNRFIFVHPPPHSPAAANLPYILRQLPAGLDTIPIINTYPGPNDFDLPDDAEKYYTVIIGEEAGVFASWIEAGLRTQRLKKNETLWHMFDTKEEALESYRQAHAKQAIRVTPIPGGIFDKRVVLPPFPPAP